MTEKPAPQFALWDNIGGKLLTEEGGVFKYAPSLDAVTLYADAIDAEFARLRAGGDTAVKTFHPIVGITKGY